MIQRIKCAFGFHDLVNVKFLEGAKYKLVCKCCGVKKLMLGSVVLPWDDDCDRLEKAYDLKLSFAEDLKKLENMRNKIVAYCKERGIEIAQ